MYQTAGETGVHKSLHIHTPDVCACALDWVQKQRDKAILGVGFLMLFLPPQETDLYWIECRLGIQMLLVYQ